MPAINPLSTTLLPVINTRSEAASRLTLSIVNVSDSPETLVRHKRAENTDAHNLAYSAYLPTQNREKRDNQGNIPYGTYSEHTCYKVLNKLEQGKPLVDIFPYPPVYQTIYDEYQRVITSADCKHYISTSDTSAATLRDSDFVPRLGRVG